MSEFVDIGRAKRMSKKADTPDCEYGCGLRECAARSNPLL